MQHHVHGAKPRCGVHQFPAAQGAGIKELFLLPVQFVVLGDVVVGRQQEAAGAAGRIADRLTGSGRHHLYHGLDQRPGGKVLPGAAFGVLGVLLQQPLVGVSLHVGAHDRPVFLVKQVHQQTAQLGWVLELVLCPAEDEAE